jgi:hypothetical protein
MKIIAEQDEASIGEKDTIVTELFPAMLAAAARTGTGTRTRPGRYDSQTRTK